MSESKDWRNPRFRRDLTRFLAEFTEQDAKGWSVRAAFSTERHIQVSQTVWALWLQVHFVENDVTDRQIMASVFFSAKKLSSSRNRILRNSGWYDAVKNQLARVGLDGAWSTDGKHAYGDFWRYGLKSTTAALDLIHILGALKFPAPATRPKRIGK